METVNKSLKRHKNYETFCKQTVCIKSRNDNMKSM